MTVLSLPFIHEHGDYCTVEYQYNEILGTSEISLL